MSTEIEIGTYGRKMFIKIAYNGDVAFLLRWIHRDTKSLRWIVFVNSMEYGISLLTAIAVPQRDQGCGR